MFQFAQLILEVFLDSSKSRGGPLPELLPPPALVAAFRTDLQSRNPDGDAEEMNDDAYYLALMRSLDLKEERERAWLKARERG